VESSVGIMSVVEGVGRHMEDDQEPTWEEAVAEFEAAAPVELVRPPRKFTVVYRYTDGIFTATSPALRSFELTGRSLHETRELVKRDLGEFLDPEVEVEERYPASVPATAAASSSRLDAPSLPGVLTVSSVAGATRAFISAAKASLRRVRAV
jgi:hypothetical protein